MPQPSAGPAPEGLAVVVVIFAAGALCPDGWQDSPSIFIIPAPLDLPPVAVDRVDDMAVSAAMRAPDPMAGQTRSFQSHGIHHFLARGQFAAERVGAANLGSCHCRGLQCFLSRRSRRHLVERIMAIAHRTYGHHRLRANCPGLGAF